MIACATATTPLFGWTAQRLAAAIAEAEGLVAAAPALAQQQTLKVTPSIRLTETITDNAGLTGAGQFTAAKSTTTLTPAAFFDSASAVDATVAPRDPRAFDFTAST